MKIAIITDQHFGVRNDSIDFLKYYEECYSKIFLPEIDKRNIKVVLDLGDTFDRRKYLNVLTLHKAKNMWFDQLRDRRIELHSLIGNHTTYYRNTNAINTLDTFLKSYPNITIYADPKEVQFDSCKILMMPWINSTNYHQCFDAINKTTAQIMFGHLEIKGYEMYRGTPSHEGFDENLFSKFDLVGSGHFHKRTISNKIMYFGAPYQMIWSDYNCPRGFHIFDTETREFEYIQNPLQMFHKLFYNDKPPYPDQPADYTLDIIKNLDLSYIKDTYVKVVVQNKTDSYLFDAYVQKVYDAGPIDVDIVEDHRNLDSLDPDEIIGEAEDTKTILKKYIYSIETKIPHDDLNGFMQTLYNEAIDTESLLDG